MTLAGLTLMVYERECLIYDSYLRKTNLKQKLQNKNNKKKNLIKMSKVALDKIKKDREIEVKSFLTFLKSVTVSLIVSTINLEDMELIKGLYAINAIIGGTDNKVMAHVPGKSLKPKHVLLQVRGDSAFCYDLLGSLVFKFNPRLQNKQLNLSVETNSLGIIFVSFNELNVMLNASKYFDFFGWKNKFGVAFVTSQDSEQLSKVFLSSLNL